MRRAALMVVALAVLGVTGRAPVQGEWILEASETFMAESRVERHPCCPRVLAVIEEVETPATVCAYYVNNFRRGQRGRVSVRSEAHGLESGLLLGRWRAAGKVRDNLWMECAYLGAIEEPCVLTFEFALAGLPRMKNRFRRRDGFAAGVLAMRDPASTVAAHGEHRRHARSAIE